MQISHPNPISIEARSYWMMPVQVVAALPRAVAWCIGGVLGAIVAGFKQGWEDCQ